jgi:hypothetical protein
MDYPIPQRDRANLSRDAPTLRSSRRGDPRSERSGPTANSPNGPATGAVPTVSAALGHKLDGRRSPEFGSGRLGGGIGSRLYRPGREGQPGQECNDRRAHFRLHRRA